LGLIELGRFATSISGFLARIRVPGLSTVAPALYRNRMTALSPAIVPAYAPSQETWTFCPVAVKVIVWWNVSVAPTPDVAVLLRLSERNVPGKGPQNVA